MKRIKKETTIANLHHKSRCTASLIAAGMPAKMTMENQIPGVRLAILTSLQTIVRKRGRRWGNPTTCVAGMDINNNNNKGQHLHVKKRKNSVKRAKPGIRHPHTWANNLRKSSFKNTHAPQHSPQHYLQQPKQNLHNVPDRLKGKEDVLHMDNGPLFNHEKVLLKLWNYASGHQVDGPRGIIH